MSVAPPHRSALHRARSHIVFGAMTLSLGLWIAMVAALEHDERLMNLHDSSATSPNLTNALRDRLGRVETSRTRRLSSQPGQPHLHVVPDLVTAHEVAS